MQCRKIVVVSMGNTVTGGPEALHHLAAELIAMGLPASICYYPFHQKFSVPEPYQKFNVPVSQFQDEASTLFIFPEILPMDALAIKNGKAAIWWLSLDHFYEHRYFVSPLRNFLRYLKLCYRGHRRPWFGVRGMKSIGHLAQSHYVKDHLISRGVDCHDLFEPVNPVYIQHAAIDTHPLHLEDVVLYNPAKGMSLTQLLIDANPDIQFVPLRGFTKEQLLEKFKHAKLYIDFGHHPGRDRMPREAALLGCCIITSRLGSAANDKDIPIPENYKFNTQSADFVQQASSMIRSVLAEHTNHFDALRSFREKIMSEDKIFKQNIVTSMKALGGFFESEAKK